jgi:hypothetical protein
MADECDVETRAKVLAFARSTGILAYEARAHAALRVELM